MMLGSKVKQNDIPTMVYLMGNYVTTRPEFYYLGLPVEILVGVASLMAQAGIPVILICS